MKAVIYSDYVCPFCFLEIPALERLRDEEGVELDYQAFELRPEPVPTLPPNGEYLTRVWAQSVYPMARRLGVTIRLPPVQPRSRLAFEGAEFARDAGRLDAYTRAVHEAFFQRGHDIASEDVLAGVAAGVGLGRQEFVAALRDHRHLQRVLAQERGAAELGITSVPSVILGNYVIAGAVPFETLSRAVEMARSGASTARGGVARRLTPLL
jgi:predicted DsbA family dithiol-disulfide isomerase